MRAPKQKNKMFLLIVVIIPVPKERTSRKPGRGNRENNKGKTEGKNRGKAEERQRKGRVSEEGATPPLAPIKSWKYAFQLFGQSRATIILATSVK